MVKVICFHGALGTSAQVGAILKALPKGTPATAFDFPAHGKVPNHRFDWCLLKEFIIQQLKEQDSPLVLIGFSMGGYMLLSALDEMPKNVKGTLTIGTRLFWNEEQVHIESKRLHPERLLSKAPHFVQKLKDEHGENWSELIESTLNFMQDLAAKDRIIPSIIHQTHFPVWITQGEKDQLALPEHLDKIKENAASVVTKIIPGCGHSPDEFQPDALRSLCAEFLSNCSGYSSTFEP